jgi:drug/metabolite transporter (DMT)-like permease
MLLLNETVNLHQIVGVAMVLFEIYLVNKNGGS